jgi:hypothetical protein
MISVSKFIKIEKIFVKTYVTGVDLIIKVNSLTIFCYKTSLK